MNMTTTEFCCRVKLCVEETLAALHIRVVIHAPKKYPAGGNAFCPMTVEVYIDLSGGRGTRQFVTLSFSPTRCEIEGGVMVNSHAISLIGSIIKEHAFYIKMRVDVMADFVRSMDRVLVEMQGIG